MCSFVAPNTQAMDYAKLLVDSRTKQLIWALTAAAIAFVGTPLYQEYKKDQEYNKYAQYKDLNKSSNDPTLTRPNKITIDAQYLKKFLNNQLAIQQEAQLPIWNRIPEDPTNALPSHFKTALHRFKHLENIIPDTQDEAQRQVLLAEQERLDNWGKQADAYYEQFKYPYAALVPIFLRNYWNQVLSRVKMIEQTPKAII